MRRLSKRLVLPTVIVVTLVVLGYGLWRHRFPYGYSHCCDKLLYFALEEFAAGRDGQFPSGEATSEASLSLLYGNVPWVDASLLRGKTVPEDLVQKILDRGGRLSPETCGWYYVEGLRIDDDPRIAIFWDKAGLDHHGGRMNGREVWFVNGNHELIPDSEWQSFLQQQRALLAQRTNDAASRLDASIRIRDKLIHAQLRVVDDSLYGRVWIEGRNSFSELLAHIDTEPQLGIVGLPIVTTAEFRDAKVVVDNEQGCIRFILGGTVVLFDGSRFNFE